MLFVTGRHSELESLKHLFGEEEFDKIDKFYQTENRDFFRTIDSDQKYLGVLARFPYKSFSFIYLRPVNFIKIEHIARARILCNQGIVFNINTVPAEVENIMFKFADIKKSNKKFDEAKAFNDNLEEKYKSEKKEIKAKNKVIKEKNKELEKVWKENKKILKKKFDASIKDMTDEQLEFMPKEPNYEPEPDYETLLKAPREPIYKNLPYSESIHLGDNRLDKKYPIAWMIFSSFIFYTVEGTNYGFLKKREEPLKYTYDNLDSMSTDNVMTRDEFIKYFKKTERNEKSLDDYRQDVATNYDFLDVFTDNNKMFEKSDDWIFNESMEEVNDEMFPALAPIKPMHAASILSAGMKFSKKVKTDEGSLLIKSAPVKVFKEVQKVSNGKRITDIYQSQETQLSIYNMDRRDLEIY